MTSETISASSVNGNTTATVIEKSKPGDINKLVFKKRKIIYPKYETYKACICGGEYFGTGKAFPSYPMQYEYKCNKCGNIIGGTIWK